MSISHKTTRSTLWWLLTWISTPLWLVLYPLGRAWRAIDKSFVSYMTGRVLRGPNRIFSIKFVWYGDSVYLHPMIWGSAILYLLASSGVVSTGWLLFLWFIGLFVCYLAIMYNLNVVRCGILITGVVALLGIAYFSTVELEWNPVSVLANHVRGLEADVSPGFYIAASYLFAILIGCEIVWAWLFHRVEIDESYVYEHQFLQGTSREPIFARGLKRETKDLLEVLLMGAADIQHRTKKGFKRFKNVPFGSLWLGEALDSMLDYKRKGQVLLERQTNDDESDQVRVEDAFHEEADDWDDDVDDTHDDVGDDIDDDDVETL